MKLLARSVVSPYILAVLMVAPMALAQTPPAVPPAQTPSTTQTPNPASAPPPPLPPDEYKNLSEISVELYYWKQTSHPEMRPGKANFDGDSTTLGSGINLLGPSKGAEGIMVTAPAGRANRLEFEYFQTKQSGNEVAPTNLILFGQGYLQGDALASTTKIQHARVSWSYLTYPDPPGVHKFRFRTLYGVEYTSITARFDAPADLNAAPIEASRSIIFPTLGVGAEYHFSKRALIEAKAEGFTWPHRAVQGDADAKVAVKLFKQLDLVVGGRYFYFKTNPQKDYYLKSSMFGPYGGLRWTFK